MKKELENLKNANHANTTSIDHTRTPLASKSVNLASNPKRFTINKSGGLELDGLKLPELKEEHSKLQGNFTKLHKKYSELESAHAKLNEVLHNLKKGYDQWKDHANQLDEISTRRSQTIKKLKAKLAAAAAAASDPLDASFSSDIPTRPASRQQMVTSELAEIDVPNKFLTNNPLPWLHVDIGTPDHEPTTGISRTGEKRNTPSGSETHESTQDAGDTPTLPPLPQNRDLDTTPVHIKHEPSSDTPVVVSERCVRKRKHDDNQTDTPQVAAIKTESGSDPLITDARHNFVAHESIDFDAEGTIVQTPRKRSRRNPQLDDRAILDSPRLSRFSTRLLLGENPEPSQLLTGYVVPLKPSGRSDRLQPMPKPIRGGESSPHRRSLATPVTDSDQHRVSKFVTGGTSRVGQLRGLNTPSPRHEATPFSPGDQPEDDLDQQERELRSEKGPSTTSRSHDSSNPSNRKPAPIKPTTKQLPNGRTTNDEGGGAISLRDRPKSELSITDFKVNPAANDGYDYAFTEVVRKKDERAKLTGCVQENCCGKTFRLQAHAMRPQTSPVDFHALLERYLGDEAWKLSTMTKPEKEDMWVEAKMRELSNEHSKHRHRYHRAASPPGFWRIGFPTTQEELEDNEEAARMERQMVEERYHEAMRPGGRWLFRDE